MNQIDSQTTDIRHVQRLWEGDRAEPLLQMPFLGLLAMQLELVLGRWPHITTAATDGKHVFGNIDFLLRLTPEERVFVLAHEVWHCAALHPLRRGGREHTRWNCAVDYETNAVLQEAGLTVPDGALLDARYNGLNAESIYQRLPETPKDRGAWADTHGLDGGMEATGDQTALTEHWRAWPQRVRAAAQQARLRAGKLTGAARILVQGIFQPRINWQDELRRFITHRLSASRTWSRPNRRQLAQGTWLPGRSRERIELALAVDTSGSTLRVLDRFAAALRGIFQAVAADARIRLITFDAVIQEDRTFDVCPDLGMLQAFKGGGGTSFYPMFERLRKEPPDGMVVFTDGCGRAPREGPGYPVLWALTEGGNMPVIWGEVLHVETVKSSD